MSPAARIHRCCPLCGLDNASKAPSRYSSGEWTLKKCRDCSMVYLENALPTEKFAEDFAWEKSFPLEAKRRQQQQPVIHFLSRLTKRLKPIFRRDKLTALIDGFFTPGPILDVGCGGGRAMVTARSDFTPYGVEISKELATRAHSIAFGRGGRVVQADAVSGMQSFSAHFFKGVIMHAYLEHEIQPIDALKAALRVLEPGGKLIIKVPNFNSVNRLIRGTRWCGFRLPDHINYWTPHTLVKAAVASGFEVLRFGFFDHLPTSDNMWLVCRHKLTPQTPPSRDTQPSQE